MPKLITRSDLLPLSGMYTYISSPDGSSDGKCPLSAFTDIPFDQSQSTTVTFTSGMSDTEIQSIIDAQPKYLREDDILTFQFSDGTYSLSGDLNFNGFYGSGAITIIGNPSDTSGPNTSQSVHLDFTSAASNGIVCSFNTLPVITIEKIKVTVDDGYTCILVQNRGYYIIRYNYCINVGKTSTNSNGIYVTVGSNGAVLANNVSNNYYGIRADNNAKVDSFNNNDTGTQPTYGLGAFSNGVIGKTSGQPDGSTANEISSNGGEIRS